MLDTDVVSRISPLASGRIDVRPFLEAHERVSFVSAITIAELHQGMWALRLRGSVRKADLLSAWIEEFERSTRHTILIVTSAVGRVTGELLARARAAGHDPGFADACLAATASVHGFQVVTFNSRHFAALGVPHRSPVAGDETP